nr:hypothetical protein [Deltaproteobacteria bacterium]
MMICGTVLVMVVGARDARPVRPTPVPARWVEAPWLTREASAQLIGPGGTLGPLFAGVILGGSAPPAAIRERIAAFAAEHDVDIDLEIRDSEVVAVEVGVTFDGGFGYEGADVLALRLLRPSFSGCGVPKTWLNDWGLGLDDGTYLHARVRVNRIEVRWIPTMSQTEVLTFAESLLDARISDVRRLVGDRLLDRGGSAEVEIPFAATRDDPFAHAYGDFAMHLLVEEGRVASVRVDLRGWNEEQERANTRLVTARFGRPRKHHNEHSTWWRWRRPDRIIDASTYDDVPGNISFTTLAYQRQLDARQ